MQARALQHQDAHRRRALHACRPLLRVPPRRQVMPAACRGAPNPLSPTSGACDRTSCPNTLHGFDRCRLSDCMPQAALYALKPWLCIAASPQLICQPCPVPPSQSPTHMCRSQPAGSVQTLSLKPRAARLHERLAVRGAHDGERRKRAGRCCRCCLEPNPKPNPKMQCQGCAPAQASGCARRA